MNRKILRTGIVATLLITMFAVAMTPVEASYDLRGTNDNVAWLWTFTNVYGSSAWSSYGSSGSSLLNYDYGIILNTFGAGTKSVTVGTIKATKIGDGQCVAFAKAMSNTNNIATPSWIRGNKVMDGGVLPGTIIATFDPYTKKYSGHVAMMDSYHIENNVVKGINVWDQNYVSSLVVGKHRILSKSTSGVNDANSYYVVKLP